MGTYFNDKNIRKFDLAGHPIPGILFLCEGESEVQYVDLWLSQQIGISNNACVLCFAGLSQIDVKISDLAKDPAFSMVKTVCLFLDAEQDFDQRKRHVVKILRELGFPHSASGSAFHG